MFANYTSPHKDYERWCFGKNGEWKGDEKENEGNKFCKYVSGTTYRVLPMNDNSNL